MKLTLVVFTLLLATQIPAQKSIKSKSFGKLEFVELEYGLAKVEAGSVETLPNTPTRTHGWLKDFQVIKASDSIQAEMKANFGVVYMIKPEILRILKLLSNGYSLKKLLMKMVNHSSL